MTETSLRQSRHDASWRQRWDAFWFSPDWIVRAARLRVLLCLLAAAYFISSWSDIRFWYTGQGPLSPSRVASFLQSSGLQAEARWIVSPLFWFDSLWMYQTWLVASVALAVIVAAGRGGRAPAWLLWASVVAWANRSMFLSGIAETLLSLGMFATAIAPPVPAKKLLPVGGPLKGRRADPGIDADSVRHWSAGFAIRLLAVQATLFVIATVCSMLAGPVWWNGYGAYAIAAPVQDRTIDWTQTLLVSGIVHETLTHLLVVMLPIGAVLAWRRGTWWLGQAMISLWCLVIALLSSHWLYAGTLAVMSLAMGRQRNM